MRDFKRIVLLSGHYGSGKTNLAVNLALELKKTRERVSVADLDIVNPYFRSADSKQLFSDSGIELICSEYANTNVDIPALPAQIYTITANHDSSVIIDVGGDDRGALALGRIVPGIKAENNYEMLMVINCFRPLTRDAASTVEVMKEIEAACSLSFTGLINNSNVGDETTAKDILQSVKYAEEISNLTGLEVVMTSVRQDIYPELSDKIPNLFPLLLQKRPV